MEVKLFEVRDRLTFISVVAVLMRPGQNPTVEPAESYLLRRSGYALDERAPRLIALGRVEANGGPFHYDPFAWRDRTMTQAHAHIEKHWDALSSGAVIDVEYILGETTRPKTTERGLSVPCDECDPSFGCFDGSTPCQKPPAPVATTLEQSMLENFLTEEQLAAIDLAAALDELGRGAPVVLRLLFEVRALRHRLRQLKEERDAIADERDAAEEAAVRRGLSNNP